MGFLQDLLNVFRALIVTPPSTTPGPGPTPAGPVQPAAIGPMHRRVLVINYDPPIPSEGGRRLHQVVGWNDPRILARACAAELLDVSGGLADFQIVDIQDVDRWPAKVDGFSYTPEMFLGCLRAGGGWHDPDQVDYPRVVTDHNLLARVASGDLDEVWLMGTPSAGFWESTMCGPGAFWCNSSPVPGTDASRRRFVIMGFNYERGVGEMLESFSHRVESCLEQAWRRAGAQQNLWKLFTLYDKIAPGRAQCGNVHYAPNSARDYDWGNARSVTCYCDDWLTFPQLPGKAKTVNCAEWGNGDIRAHHRWWLSHLPKVAGQTNGVANNWWQFAVDPNTVL